MARYLDIATAIFAFVAAGFWFASAFRSLPKMVTYWDSAPTNDPFFVAMNFSSNMNRTAAALSGASALCAGLKLFF
jgi:hypothetical protein